jgi:hypothetical protein
MMLQQVSIAMMSFSALIAVAAEWVRPASAPQDADIQEIVTTGTLIKAPSLTREVRSSW